jgi:hypothetical protein
MQEQTDALLDCCNIKEWDNLWVKNQYGLDYEGS